MPRRRSGCPGCLPRRGPADPVFFTRHMSLPARLMGAAQLRTAMAWQHVDDPEKVQSWFLRDTPGFQIVPELSPRGDEAVFDKLAMSAFAGTPLEMALRDLGIRAFAIAGVALEIGIGPTVWHAVDLGFIPVVVTDACGGRTPGHAARVTTSGSPGTRCSPTSRQSLRCCPALRPGEGSPLTRFRRPWSSVKSQSADKPDRIGQVRCSSHSPPGKGDSRHVMSALRGDKRTARREIPRRLSAGDDRADWIADGMQIARFWRSRRCLRPYRCARASRR